MIFFKKTRLPLSFLFILSLIFMVSPAAYGAPFKPDESEICKAARRGDLNMVKALVEGGADINSSNTKCNNVYVKTSLAKTVLQCAAEAKQWEVVKWLVEHGADVNKGDAHNNNAFYYVAKEKNWESLKILVDHGAYAPYPLYWLKIWLFNGCSNFPLLLSLMIQDRVFVILMIAVFVFTIVYGKICREKRRTQELKSICDAIRGIPSDNDKQNSPDEAENNKTVPQAKP